MAGEEGGTSTAVTAPAAAAAPAAAVAPPTVESGPATAAPPAADGGASASAATQESGVSTMDMRSLRTALQERPAESGDVRDHVFWSSQPVPRMDDPDIGPNDPRGPIVPSDVGAVPKDALKLPQGFEWVSVALDDEAELSELYTLLNENYVEDTQAMFRFDYSRDFIRWAMMPPGWKRQWHVGVRVTASRKLVAFVGATPADIVVFGDTIRAVEVNFLCVHKKLRTKRLAPVLIREVTRRCNVDGVFQAAYTAGVVIPKPVGRCQYWHRSLNPKKLIEVGFSHLGQRMTMSRTIKMLKLPESPQIPGFRELRPEDVPVCCRMLNEHLKRFKYYQHFSEEEFAHWMLPKVKVVYSFVVEAQTGEVTDLVSFYNLQSSIIRNEKYPTLFAAYSYYTVAKTVTLGALMTDAMIMACKHGFDVFNALDVQDNGTVMKDLKFGIGDGKLQYYIYNWRCPPMEAKDVGLILL